MRIAIGSDKSGFSLKEFLKPALEADGYTVDDLGTQDVEQPKTFFQVAPAVSEKVAAGEYEYAILICGTGMGMSQVANKYNGVLAACCESVYAAKMCRAVNNSNILCMGGWVIANEMGLEMARAFLSTEHTQGLETWRQAFLKKALLEVKAIDDRQRK